VDIVVLALSKKFTKNLVAIGGTLTDIVRQSDGTLNITYTPATGSPIVFNAGIIPAGKSITAGVVGSDGHLTLTFDDGTTLDVGNVTGGNGETPQFQTVGNMLQFRFPSDLPGIWTDLYEFTSADMTSVVAGLQAQIDDLYFQVGDIGGARIPVTIQVMVTGELVITQPLNLQITRQGGPSFNILTDADGYFKTMFSPDETYTVSIIDSDIGGNPFSSQSVTVAMPSSPPPDPIPITLTASPAATLDSLSIGEEFSLEVDGVPTPFVVAHKGAPSPIYDASFDGNIIVLMRDVLANRAWNNPNDNDYANSQIHAWLNGDFFNSLDAYTQSQIVPVRIPYRSGSGASTTVSQDASGLLCNVFLLSGREVGTGVAQYLPNDGATLDLFSGIETTAANAMRIANRSGSAAMWWLRSPWTNGATSAWYVFTSGLVGNFSASNNARGPRPALVLPADFLI